MKRNISSTNVLQLMLVVALFCLLMVSAEDSSKKYNRRSHGWTKQAMFLYGIMGPRRNNDMPYSTMKRTAWGPRANIMRAWHPKRTSRDVEPFEDIDDDNNSDDDSKRGWTGRSRIFGRGGSGIPLDDLRQRSEKRVPEEVDYEQFPLLKRMLQREAERRGSHESDDYPGL